MSAGKGSSNPSTGSGRESFRGLLETRRGDLRIMSGRSSEEVGTRPRVQSAGKSAPYGTVFSGLTPDLWLPAVLGRGLR